MIRDAIILGGLLLPVSVAAQTPSVPTTIPEMWSAWCARCHGQDGSGQVTQRTVSIEPRDFTDCKTATGEGDPDWELAITKGGPAVGLSDEMPAFGDALTADQIAGFVSHLRKFCRETGWPDGNLNLGPIFTERRFPDEL
jgi:mono/diheme cytochrome c family protein